MELTQRLECTQEIYSDNNCNKSFPEQIGFLGICGNKYPLKKGPNKVGRDPETCNIVLNLGSISRQHAVINILNSRDFMLMDLDSANKTKLSDKTLLPYIPHPLQNGDMVQFGDVFGVFRLLQEENDLPMTQAMDIPDTPVQNRYISKLNIHATTIPESPEVSDKEDSFIATSQQKPKNVFKSPNSKFLKSSGRTIAIKPVGTNQIDNVFWSSSKKSDSFSTQSNFSGNLDDSVALLQNSHTHTIEQSIYDMDTQIPYVDENVSKQIQELDSQMPNINQNESLDSIYNANTQIVNPSSPNNYEIDTQLPNLPEVCKIGDKNTLEINFCTENKENNNNIHNAETQITFYDNPISRKDNIFSAETQVTVDVNVILPKANENIDKKSNLSSQSNVSDDIILFDEIDSEPLENNFESQQLLLPNIIKDKQSDEIENVPESQIINFAPLRRVNRIQSDSSTDCEDINIAPNQIITTVTNIDDDLTDCEDEPNTVLKITERKPSNEDVTDCEDLNDDEIIKPNRVIENENFEDLPTQVLEDTNIDKETTKIADKENWFEELPTQVIGENKNTESGYKTNIQDIPTQLLIPNGQSNTPFEEALTQQIYSEEVVQFKAPFTSPIKNKKKNSLNIKNYKSNAVIKVQDDDQKYYAATQELFDDLCTQRPISPDVKNVATVTNRSTNDITSVSKPLRTISSESSDAEEKINDYISSLSCSQIKDVVGVQKDVIVLKKLPSDSSDYVVTPIKLDSLFILETDLPNTQEIKSGISVIRYSDTESLTDNRSESEIDSVKGTPIKLKHRPKASNKIRINLSDKFDPETIPVRTSTRTRKPTSKMQNCDEPFQIIAENILKPVLIKKQDIKADRRPSKDKTHKHKKEKSSKSNIKLEDSDLSNTSTRDVNDKAKKNISLEAETNFEKKYSRRSKKTKQKDEADIDKKTLKTTQDHDSRSRNMFIKQNQEISRKDELNSNNKNKRKCSKEMSLKDEQKSNNKRSKSPEISRIKEKPTNEACKSLEVEIKRQLSIERPISPEMRIKKKPTKDTSNIKEVEIKVQPIERPISPKIGINKKPTKETSKSKEVGINTNTKGRPVSPEIRIKKKSTKERSRSPAKRQKSKTTKERPRSPEIEKSTKSTEAVGKSAVLKSEETDVRRSQRNRKKKSEEPINISKTKSSKGEQSRVYSNVSNSFDSTTCSPSHLKRPAVCELDMPNAKKPRNAKNKSIPRATPARKAKIQYVLFTAFANDEVKEKLEKLGAVIVSDVKTCSVVLTLQIKRTFKLLCAVGLGKPIVGPNWVQACADTNMIVDPWLYLLQDEATERRFKFNLHHSLVGKREFLKGYNVSSTPNVMPNAQEMKLIVECSGGKWKEGGPRWICVSGPADRALWAGLKLRGAVVVSTEFILGGVLKQTLEIEANML